MSKVVLVSLGILLIVGLAITGLLLNNKPASQQVTSPTVLTTSSPSLTVATPVFYPVTDYNSRLTRRVYGQLTKGEKLVAQCGDAFSGYHNGDDLEILEGELNTEVPVFAIADGLVKDAATVGGYGGLVVIEHILGGQTVTAYYGHVNLAKTVVKKGDRVTAGQRITILGDNCSKQTSNERKHLHFAIHKGSRIDVRGYVPTKDELAAWLNPKDILTQLAAALPVKSD